MYHWYRAAALGRFADILTVSNFSGKGPAAVGSYRRPRAVRHVRHGRQREGMVLRRDSAAAGSCSAARWNEPRYMFADYDARRPFERAPGFGFRLAQYYRPLPPRGGRTGPPRRRGPRRPARRSRSTTTIFEVYRRQYAYDRSPLNAVVEATEETERWTQDTVAFDAAYGGERVRAYLFLPENGSPPYQTVVLFPAGDAFQLRSSRDMSLVWVDSHRPQRPGPPLSRLQGHLRAVRARRRSATRPARAADRLVAGSRARHRLSRDAAGHRSGPRWRSTA